ERRRRAAAQPRYPNIEDRPKEIKQSQEMNSEHWPRPMVQSHSPNIERPSPPRFSAREKVPKADEGAFPMNPACASQLLVGLSIASSSFESSARVVGIPPHPPSAP